MNKWYRTTDKKTLLDLSMVALAYISHDKPLCLCVQLSNGIETEILFASQQRMDKEFDYLHAALMRYSDSSESIKSSFGFQQYIGFEAPTTCESDSEIESEEGGL